MSRGWMAEYDSADALLAAARAARAAGYRRVEAYTPFPVEGLAGALGVERTPVPLATLLGGIAGGSGGYLLQWWSAVVDLPLNIGGRPTHSWPMFVPVTFELTILGAALAAVATALLGSGLPRLRDRAFDLPHVDLATRNRFFLRLTADDPAFDAARAAALLDDHAPVRRFEAPA